MTGDAGGDDSDDGWRFGIDDVGPDTGGDGDAAADGTEGNVLGSTDTALENPEPGSPTAENAFFVLLGVAAMIGIIALLVL